MNLEFDLVLLGFLKGNVVFCQSSLPLPVLQQYEPDHFVKTIKELSAAIEDQTRRKEGKRMKDDRFLVKTSGKS
jgi:hypothetical protein